MNPSLIVFAKVVAKADQRDFVAAQLSQLVLPTQQEAGCLQYHLHQDNSDDAIFMFHEIWRSKDDLNIHMNSAHFVACMSAIQDAILSVNINEMTAL